MTAEPLHLSPATLLEMVRDLGERLADAEAYAVKCTAVAEMHDRRIRELEKLLNQDARGK